jgi:hypothetical protein
MRYQQISAGANFPYPDNNIDPKIKQNDISYCLQYAKSSFFDWSFSYPKGVFYNNNGDYEKFRMYALGKQPISQYKKQLGVDEVTNETWMSVDWTPRPIVSRYRDRAISRLMKQTTGVIATPVDMQAKGDMDAYLYKMKAKLAVRQLLQQQNPELAAHPAVSLQAGEPMDTEELEMRIMMGEQFARSEDAENAIELGFYEGDYKYVRRCFYEDLFDFGVTGYKEWLGDDNKAKFRKVNAECVITNFCRHANFDDMVHAGEVIDVSLIDLALVTDANGNRQFTEEQLTEFAGTLAGRWGNPAMIGKASGWYKPYDKFKCKVFDLEFYSYDEYNYKMVVDENGQLKDYLRADYNRGRVATDKYDRKRIKSVYKIKWIVGTDYGYDWGLVEDQKRSADTKKKAETSLSYKFFAYNFYEMKAQGIMERLVPYLDDYQLTMLKIQNFKNRAVPSGWWIDFDALENVAMNKGGKNMTPRELLKMFFETGVLVGRSKDASGNPMGPNWKPVIPMSNTAASELAMLYQDLVQTITQIESTTGYNAITSGDPNPKTLVPGYETANISTDDALYPLAFAEAFLTQKLAEDVLCRMKQGVRKGEVSGMVPYKYALNSNTLMFMSVNPDIAERDHGIMLEEASTDQEKAWIMQQVQQDIMNGFLDVSDAILIISTHNAKAAMAVLAYKVKKAKEQLAMQKQQELQIQGQQSQQAAMIAAQSQQQMLQLELQSKERMKQMEVDGELKKEDLKQRYQLQAIREQNITKNTVAETTGQAKILSTHISNLPKLQESEQPKQ